MFSDPGILVPMALAAILYIAAALLIIYHRAGLEYVGGAMVILGTLWLLRDANSPGWIVLISGIAFHGIGRSKRWLKIGQVDKQKKEGADRPDGY